MQLLPDTAKGIALRTGGAKFVLSDLRDPEINVRYGSWYLDHLRDRYDSDTRLALAAYHAGQGNVDRWLADGSGIAFPETRAYVDEVERVRRVYAKAYPDELGRRSDRASHERDERVDVADRLAASQLHRDSVATMLTKPAIFSAGTSSRRSPRACPSRTCSMSAGASSSACAPAAG